MPNDCPTLVTKARYLSLIVLAGLNWVPYSAAHGQVTLSYGSINTGITAGNSDQGRSANAPRNYVELGYDLPLTGVLTLTPSFGFLNEQFSPVTTISEPSGYKLGLWGQYDLLAYSTGNAYAQGGLTYLDYELGSGSNPTNESELQFALGVGADLEIGENVSAFTNLNYIFSGESSLDLLNLDAPETGLEVGIEISF